VLGARRLPLAALATFVTNPFTTPLIWVAAYWVGGWLLQGRRRRQLVAPVNTAIEQDRPARQFSHG
jgi:uncharacterized protein (DUF2062 family)